MLIAIGTAALTGLATALVFLGRKALRGESGRRGINVLWDVISFWPRSAHPFVPAAYSQRAVPDLVDLISVQLADDREADLVLCGHSQGSLLSFAALLRLQAIDAELLRRIGFLTFGSQLQVMFSRAFPAYVNHDAINRLFEALDGRWRNLYRDTDHLAGPVLSWAHNREAGMATHRRTRAPEVDPGRGSRGARARLAASGPAHPGERRLEPGCAPAAAQAQRLLARPGVDGGRRGRPSAARRGGGAGWRSSSVPTVWRRTTGTAASPWPLQKGLDQLATR